MVFGSRSPFEGLVTGIFIGTGKAIQRTGIGVFEAATFYVPSYDPILKPEFVGISLSSATDDFGDPRSGLHVRPSSGIE